MDKVRRLNADEDRVGEVKVNLQPEAGVAQRLKTKGNY